ncbi:uncharacterized protein TNCV_475901 [Trichonephila clavipes]|nr:uncharacterized protein TNCV_475901 [Trichonephila clavipes]
MDKKFSAPVRSRQIEMKFPPARHRYKHRRRWVGVKDSTRTGRRDPKCLSARKLRTVREDTGSPKEDATCAWMADDQVVRFTRAFLTMWRSPRRLICRGRPEPGLLVNDISRVRWSQHLLTTQSEGLIDELLASLTTQL